MRGLPQLKTIFLIAMTVLCIPAAAQVDFDTTLSHPITGSVLAFPYIEGAINLISITNTNQDRTVLSNNLMTGTIRVHYQYVGSETCSVHDRVEVLTPGDITTVLVSDHVPGFTKGWLYVVAEDFETGRPIDFDYLTGDALWIDPTINRLHDVPGIAFRSGAEESGAPAGRSTGNTWAFTDIDSDGKLDFNDIEYERMPQIHYLPTFFEQSGSILDELVLVSPLGRDYEVIVNSLMFNNDEDSFSANIRFTCWDVIKFEDISMISKNLGGNPAKSFETGWLRLVPDHAINAVTGQFVTSSNVAILTMVKRTYFGSLGMATLLAGSGEVSAVDLD